MIILELSQCVATWCEKWEYVVTSLTYLNFCKTCWYAMIWWTIQAVDKYTCTSDKHLILTGDVVHKPQRDLASTVPPPCEIVSQLCLIQLSLVDLRVLWDCQLLEKYGKWSRWWIKLSHKIFVQSRPIQWSLYM